MLNMQLKHHGFGEAICLLSQSCQCAIYSTRQIYAVDYHYATDTALSSLYTSRHDINQLNMSDILQLLMTSLLLIRQLMAI